MPTLTIEDPIMVKTLRTDDRGRLTLGDQFANMDVEICVSRVYEPDS